MQDSPRWPSLFLLCASLLAGALLLLAALQERSEPPTGEGVVDLSLNLGGEPIREHCLSCHPEGRRSADQKARPHPDIAPHKYAQLGCTSCHLGEGMALDEQLSHGLPGTGREILVGRQTQASCFTCHEPGPLAGAARVYRGYRLFFDKACYLCHALDAQGTEAVYGPNLGQVGSYRSLSALREAIRYPRKDPPTSLMPRYPLSRGATRNIAYFLKGQVTHPYYLTPLERLTYRLPDPGLQTDDPRAVARQRCLACHKLGQKDGRIGPDLTWIARLRPADYLETYLSQPRKLVPGSTMPVVPVPKEKVGSLQSELAASARQTEVPQDSRRQYMQLCQRCHGAAGDGYGVIQPNLAQFPRAFKDNGTFFRYAGQKRLTQRVAQGVPGTSMPGFGAVLPSSEQQELLGLIYQSFVGEVPPVEGMTPAVPAKPALVELNRGADLYRDRCQACHGQGGAGKGPAAADLIPKPRNLRNGPYMASLAEEDIARVLLTGIPGTAMPSWKSDLTPDELWSLVVQVRSFAREVP